MMTCSVFLASRFSVESVTVLAAEFLASKQVSVFCSYWDSHFADAVMPEIFSLARCPADLFSARKYIQRCKRPISSAWVSKLMA